MAIDLRKENYDENGVRKPLTVYPDRESPEIYPQRKAGSMYVNTNDPLPVPDNGADILPQSHKAGKIKKKSILAACSLLAAMAVICLFFAGEKGIEPKKNSSGQIFNSEDIQTIDIKSSGNTSLDFVYDTEGSENITVRTKNENYPVSFTADDSCLSVECGGTEANTPVTVVLPKGYDGRIKVNGGEDCDISVNAGSDLDIYIKSGEINAAGLKAECANFSVTKGNVDVSGSIFSNLNVHIGSGDASVCDSRIGNSLYANIIKGIFEGRRIASDGTTNITADGDYTEGEAKHGGDIYCEDILMGGTAELIADNSIELYRADFRDIKLDCNGSTVKVRASQSSDIYRSFNPYGIETEKLKYNADGIYELKVLVSDIQPDFEFDCDPPAEPRIVNS